MKIKKLIFVVILLLFFSLIAFLLFNRSKNSDIVIENTDKQDRFVVDQNMGGNMLLNNYEIIWFTTDSKNINLYPNFKDRLTAEDAFIKNTCKSLINGGFYDENNNPIGLFISNNEILNTSEENSLFNGYIYKNGNQNVVISNLPSDNSIFSTQTGPLLIFNNIDQKINVSNSKNSRRMIAGILDKGQVIFLSIYNHESVFLGPTIGEINELLGVFEKSTDLDIIHAINLDGGTASAFYTSERSLAELSFIGSYFCIK